MRFCEVVDYTDTRFLNFAIFAKMEKFAKPFFFLFIWSPGRIC